MVHKKHIITSILFAGLLVGGMKADFEIQESVFVPHDLGKVSLFHNDKGFKVFEESGVKHKVGNHNIDAILHKMDSDQLRKFLAYGYLALKKNNAGEYIIKAKVRGNGGGPILAGIFYSGTKALCYGTAVAAVSGTVIATGGAAAGAIATAVGAGASTAATATAAGTAVAEIAVTLGTGTVVNGGISLGTAVVAGTLSSTAATAAAGTTTAVVTTAAGKATALVVSSLGVSGAMAAVETAAIFMGGLGAALPFL